MEESVQKLLFITNNMKQIWKDVRVVSIFKIKLFCHKF